MMKKDICRVGTSSCDMVGLDAPLEGQFKQSFTVYSSEGREQTFQPHACGNQFTVELTPDLTERLNNF